MPARTAVGYLPSNSMLIKFPCRSSGIDPLCKENHQHATHNSITQNISYPHSGMPGGWTGQSSQVSHFWRLPVDANTGLKERMILSLTLDSAAPNTLYAGLFDGGLYKSTDGGVNWNKLINGLTAKNIFKLVIDPVSPNILYAATSKGVFKSTDSGENWILANNGITSTYVATLVIDPLTPNTLYAAASTAGLFKSTNGGGNWSLSNNGLVGLDVTRLAMSISLWSSVRKEVPDMHIRPAKPKDTRKLTQLISEFRPLPGRATR